MPAYVEIKAWLKDFSEMKKRVEAPEDRTPQIIKQEDIF